MRKLLFLGALILVTSVSAYATQKEDESVECPNGCVSGAGVCCKTKGGSTYFGHL